MNDRLGSDYNDQYWYGRKDDNFYDYDADDYNQYFDDKDDIDFLNEDDDNPDDTNKIHISGLKNYVTDKKDKEE